MAQTTTMDGDTVDYIVRWERGTINRFIYSIAVLSPDGQDPRTPDLSAWNERLIYYFQGGVAHRPLPGRSEPLVACSTSTVSGLGYAVAYSTGTKTGTHYNLELGGETAIMVKDRFVSAYGDPDYTVGVGGSGGGIQQYVYGQNHHGLIDAGDSAVLLSRHDHADDPHRRLRAARALDRHRRARRRRPSGPTGRTATRRSRV